MPENNLPTDSELKIDDLFKNIDELILKRNFDEAFNLVEENRAYITKFANVKQQLLLNKYHTKILFELTLMAYEVEKDADKFLNLFEKNRDFFEVHLDKPKYNRLLRYTSNIKKNRRKKKLNIIIPVAFFLVALLIYGVATMDILPKISFNEIYSSVAEKFKSDKPDDDADTPVPNDDSAEDNAEPDSGGASNEDEAISENNSSDGGSSDGALDEDYLLPSSTKELTLDDIIGMSSKDLRLAINEMYARHGYYFGPGANQRYFDEKPWYNPDMSIKSPNDIVENFTEIENKNLSFLATQERRLKNN
ncbi:YARHG domain-containing protein [Acetoanaerobium noterae]|uniref:YARHG domain-containing protein n=1 Tax=Acetoanaerobium noterae TaxID=745369 RepID=A0A1T5DAJ2_9FIRM|nr:YARHG domain-containing protein [Acetoanaerobium noterae]SKB68734.1 YARHG domain-containing protein [Acetoanaerobium noterae]